jgi:hypothetical protein
MRSKITATFDIDLQAWNASPARPGLGVDGTNHRPVDWLTAEVQIRRLIAKAISEFAATTGGAIPTLTIR